MCKYNLKQEKKWMGHKRGALTLQEVPHQESPYMEEPHVEEQAHARIGVQGRFGRI